MSAARVIWSTHDPARTPVDIMVLFAQTYFGEPRDVAAFDVLAAWPESRATFRLKGGLRTYHLRGVRGDWEVSVEEQGDG